jgi:hypothetical protein
MFSYYVHESKLQLLLNITFVIVAPEIGDNEIGDNEIGNIEIGHRFGGDAMGGHQNWRPHLGTPKIGHPEIGDPEIVDPEIECHWRIRHSPQLCTKVAVVRESHKLFFESQGKI